MLRLVFKETNVKSCKSYISVFKHHPSVWGRGGHLVCALYPSWKSFDPSTKQTKVRHNASQSDNILAKPVILASGFLETPV